MEPKLTCTEITKELGAAISAVLKPIGFRKKALNWTLEGAIRHRLNLQKSAWNSNKSECGYYLNIDLWVGDGVKEIPDLSGRLSSLVGRNVDDDFRFASVTKQALKERSKAVGLLISDVYVPWVSSCENLLSIRKLYSEGRLEKFLIATSFRAVLDQDD